MSVCNDDELRAQLREAMYQISCSAYAAYNGSPNHVDSTGALDRDVLADLMRDTDIAYYISKELRRRR